MGKKLHKQKNKKHKFHFHNNKNKNIKANKSNNNNNKNQNTWTTVSIDLSDYLGQEIALCFKYEGLNAHSWYIDDVSITGGTGVEESESNSLAVYPNPAREQVSFTLDRDAQVSVFDMTGRMVNQMNMAAGNAQLGVSELESGVYFVNFRFANGTTAVAKFVKF